MAGHSHWARIKHKKGATDVKRGKLFSKLAKHIISAARHGGPDPDQNLRLKYAIEKAKENLLPRDTIERAIQRGAGTLDGESAMEETVYEGYGPGGVALLIEIMTDNKMRTAPEVRHILEKAGGSLGAAGCVAWNFEKRGVLVIPKGAAPEDLLMEKVLEAGAEDLRVDGDAFRVVTDPQTLLNVREALVRAKIQPQSSELLYLPKSTVALDEAAGRQVLDLIETLEDHDDVQGVHTNAEFADALFSQEAS